MDSHSYVIPDFPKRPADQRGKERPTTNTQAYLHGKDGKLHTIHKTTQDTRVKK